MYRELVQTEIFPENSQGGLLICGINHGYSKDDERIELQSKPADVKTTNTEKTKSFFSDRRANPFDFPGRVVSWFSLWGYNLARNEDCAGAFERSIAQTNWLQSCTNNVHGTNVEKLCINDHDPFLSVCKSLQPRLILFFGQGVFGAFSSPALSTRIESIFGSRQGAVRWIKKDVLFKGKPRRRFRVGFLQYDRLSVVSLPHATGSQGLANDYIAAFKPEMSELINAWWLGHKAALQRVDSA